MNIVDDIGLFDEQEKKKRFFGLDFVPSPAPASSPETAASLPPSWSEVSESGAAPNIVGRLASGRPIVQNPDGSYSTHKNMVVGLGDSFYIVPTLYGGKEVNPDEAVDIIRKNNFVDPDTNEPLTPFPSTEAALAEEQRRHALLEREVPGAAPSSTAPPPLQGPPQPPQQQPSPAPPPLQVMQKLGQAFNEESKAGGTISPENIGALAGGTLAAPVAAMTGPFAPAVVAGGAVLGGMAGRQIERMDPRNPPSNESLIGGLWQAGKRQGIADLVGQGTLKVATPVIEAVGSGIIKTGQRMVDAAKGYRPALEKALQYSRIGNIAEREGVPLAISQQTGSTPIAQMESTPGRFAFGVGTAEKFSRGTTEAVQQRFGDYAGPAPKSLESIGIATKAAHDAELTAAKNQANQLYENINTLLPRTTKGPLTNTKAAAEKVLEDTLLTAQLSNPEITMAQVVENAVKNPAANQIQLFVASSQIPQMREGNFQQMDALRKQITEQYGKARNSTEKRAMAILLNGIDQDIEALAGGNQSVVGAVQGAREFAKKEVIERFYNNEAADKITNMDASTIANWLLAPRSSIEDIRRAKQVIPPQTWKEITQAWMSDVLKTQTVDPQTLSRSAPGEAMGSLQRLATHFSPQNYRPEVLREIFDPKIFGPDHAQRFGELIDTLRAVTTSRLVGANPSEAARGMLGGAQLIAAGRLLYNAVAGALLYNAVGKTLSGDLPSAAASASGSVALLAVPELIAQSLLTPTGIELLTKGLKINPASQDAAKQAARIAGQLVTQAAQNANRDDVSRSGAPGKTLQQMLAEQQGGQPLYNVLPGQDFLLRREARPGVSR
jgi:hypothetical protein